MERLWSPWRHRYVTRDEQPSDGCVFCQVDGPDAEALVLHRGVAAYVILNLYPYNGGHTMVVPVRHVATMAGLRDEELVEIARLTRLTEMALTEVYRPQGMNVGLNLGRPAGAGVVDHLHVHLVPRWTGDTNFMPVIGETRVLPETLDSTAARVRPVLARLVAETGAEP
ncbi:MAG: HIT domain-containing protein [Vicinamibacterales bacterium]